MAEAELTVLRVELIATEGTERQAETAPENATPPAMVKDNAAYAIQRSIYGRVKPSLAQILLPLVRSAKGSPVRPTKPQTRPFSCSRHLTSARRTSSSYNVQVRAELMAFLPIRSPSPSNRLRKPSSLTIC